MVRQSRLFRRSVADRTNVVIFNTLSKRSSMTGYRSGFVCAPPDVIGALKSFRPTVGTAPQEFVQRASIAAWSDEAPRSGCAPELYETKRDVLLPALERKGLRLAGLGGGRSTSGWTSAARRSSSRSDSSPTASSARRARSSGLRARVTCGSPSCRRSTSANARRRSSHDDRRDRSPRSTAARLRVAEPDGDGWRVNADVQAAILDLRFRERQMEPREVGPFEYHDKIPLKTGYEELGVRVVPPAVARYGSYLSPGVVLMPSYVNIGAWVGPGTMVDTWATVGSCAQIGKHVHLSGGVGIGGVLEPPGAMPVIVEDGAFIGSRCIVVEGVRIGRDGAVLAPNVTLTASVPIIDVTESEPVEHRGYVPPRSIVASARVRRSSPPGPITCRVR